MTKKGVLHLDQNEFMGENEKKKGEKIEKEKEKRKKKEMKKGSKRRSSFY